jgi:predicted ArsR family transcriptional regulator
MKASTANTKMRQAVLLLVRRGPVTVAELTRATSLTANAVRFHLISLEAEGLVTVVGIRRTTRPGKPAVLYQGTTQADVSSSHAYAPVLAACMQEIRCAIPPEHVIRFLRSVGRRLGKGFPNATRPLPTRVRAGADCLNALGGLTIVVTTETGYRIIGTGCPISEAVKAEPCACDAIESMLSEIIRARVVQKCDRSGRPNCCFEVYA